MLGLGFFGSIVVGAAAGYIAGHLTKGSGFGCWLNTIIGIVGGCLGGFLFGLIGGIPETFSTIGSLIVAVLGSLLLLWLISKIK